MANPLIGIERGAPPLPGAAAVRSAPGSKRRATHWSSANPAADEPGAENSAYSLAARTRSGERWFHLLTRLAEPS